jgi:hypothetical protein
MLNRAQSGNPLNFFAFPPSRRRRERCRAAVLRIERACEIGFKEGYAQELSKLLFIAMFLSLC